MKRKKALSILIAAAMVASATGCGGGGDASSNSAVEIIETNNPVLWINPQPYN